MLAKWIVCRVPADRREAFAAAQTRWAPLALAEGLIAQVGGWDAAHGDTACVLALWRDEPAYRVFMRHLHDPLAEQTGQAGTYTGLAVATGEVVLRMPGAAQDLRDALARGRLLRIADCTVRPGRAGSFVAAQSTLWAPAMAQVVGMLGGCFTALGDARWLVATAWADEEAHARYATRDLPALRARAAVDEDVADLVGRRVRLVDDWRVVGSP